MSGMILRLLGFFALLSQARSGHGWRMRRVTGAVAIAALTAFSLTFTLATLWITSSLIDPQAARDKIERMTRANFEAVKEDLGGDLNLSLLRDATGDQLAIRVAIGNAPQETLRSPICSRPIEQEAICLFRVTRYLPALLPDWIGGAARQIEFPTTAYSISEVAVELAQANGKSFSRARRDRTRSEIEKALEDAGLFVPSDDELVRARQLNGLVQAITYALGWWAVGSMIFLALGALLPNTVLRFWSSVGVGEDTSVKLAKDGGETTEGGATSTPDEVTIELASGSSNLIEIPTPWSDRSRVAQAVDITDAQILTRYYEAISSFFQARASVLGVSIMPAILRFRTAAARAVANTRDTSILPAFLEAERQGIDDDFHARLSSVRFLLWCIPTVGFIGTIIGVSDALSSTVGLQSARDLTKALSQSDVSAAMGMAFDTTLVALVVAVVLMFLYHGLEGAQQRMTVAEENEAREEILTFSTFVRKPGEALDLAQQLISLGVNTEALVRDLGLFQQTGPEIDRLLDALRSRVAALSAAADALKAQPRRRSWVLPLVLGGLLTIAAISLAANGYLGPIASDWMQILLNQLPRKPA